MAIIYTSKKTNTAKEHIEDIRRNKFSIGEIRPNPLTQDLHNAVTNLAAELYTKDVRFLMELIQNAEDNEYLPNHKPTLEFVITTSDITGVGAPSTLLVLNNEVGFSKKNIDSLCSIGRSTKKGRRQQGYIGEKGIGFKSVFLVSAWPHIFSNGYQIRFSEIPDQGCNIGYIVPEWIAAKPSLSDLKDIYGPDKVVPSTIIILPLKPEKLEAVRRELLEIHPEVLLFLQKIKQLSVREHSGGSCSVDTVSAISITSEINPISLSSREADSRIVDLSYKEVSGPTVASCRYYIWKQVFPVKAENVVSARTDIKEWIISIAFPFGKRLQRGTSSVGIFAFLPTSMVTNFPFILQADFILASSRETISLDNKWNMGILDSVPLSFVSALSTCMKSTGIAKFISIDQVLNFLPLRESPYKELNGVRQVIKAMLEKKRIVPYESFFNEKIGFCKPTNAIRVLPEFRDILLGILGNSAPLIGISSQWKFILHKSVDGVVNNQVWDFLGVTSAGGCNNWYGKCIQECSLISRASTDLYLELLCFLADNWDHLSLGTFSDIPLLKYITHTREMMLCSLSQINREKIKIRLVCDVQQHAWLNKWNLEMECPDRMFFFPDPVLTALVEHERRHILKQWLISKMNVVVNSVSSYCSTVCGLLVEKQDPKTVISFSHFLYHSVVQKYIRLDEIPKLLLYLPVVDARGNVMPCTTTLVPSFGSRWMKLFGSNNAFTEEVMWDKYVVLGEVYAEATEFAGECTPERKLLYFFEKHRKTVDLPDIFPKDAALRVASTQLTTDQALLLLEWIRNLRAKGSGLPVKFIESIQNGKWVKTYSGFNSPVRCFLCDGTEISSLLKIGKTFKFLSAIDEEYYMGQIRSFKDELMFIGVQMKSEGVYQLITDHIKSLASSVMNKKFAISLLSFIKHLNDINKLNVDFLKTLEEGKWLKTSKGYMTPVGSFFMKSKLAEALIQITDLKVVDNIYYGSQLDCFVDELKLLGVLMDLEDVYKILPIHFRFPKYLSTMINESVFLLLGCIRHLGPAALGLTEKVRCQPWMKTTCGFRCPSESLLSDNKWGHLLNVFPLPIIDEVFYGSWIRLYNGELEAVGVAVDFNGASCTLSAKVKENSTKLTSANVISLLKCLKYTDESMPLLKNLSCLSGEKWLKTSHGYKSAPESILYDSLWGSISQFVDLPLIDAAFYGMEIYTFKDELQKLGVVVNLSDGAHIVAQGLEMPKEPALITSECALSLLQFAMSLRKSSKSEDQSLVENFLNKLKGSKWMKTHMGYRSPEESLLFNQDWECQLKPYDAPFIDQSFCGTLHSLEKDDLKAIGVKVDLEEVCSMIFQTLSMHSQTNVIMRIYKFLNKMKWRPKQVDKFSSQLWIPDQHGTGEGTWVSSRSCVLHYKDCLFGSRLHALDKYYNAELLYFFSTVLGVASGPFREDYVKLWNDWESSNHQISSIELNSFWEYILENWDIEMESNFKAKITMLPATSSSGTVQLMKKEEVFIADDLQLKRSFSEASEKPLFVWFPQNGLSSVSPRRLYEIYIKMGVQIISESVQFDPNCTVFESCKLEKIDLYEGLVGKALIKIVLGFLVSPLINMPLEDRHEAAKSLLDISVFGIDEPITVRYALYLHSKKEQLDVQIRRLVLWEKNFRRLLVHKPSWEDGTKNLEFVTNFARGISEAVLPGTDHVDHLCNIIKVAFAFGFREDDVDFLLVTENLELPVEDKEFLDRVFAPVTCPCPGLKRSAFPSLESPSKKRST